MDTPKKIWKYYYKSIHMENSRKHLANPSLHPGLLNSVATSEVSNQLQFPPDTISLPTEREEEEPAIGVLCNEEVFLGGVIKTYRSCYIILMLINPRIHHSSLIKMPYVFESFLDSGRLASSFSIFCPCSGEVGNTEMACPPVFTIVSRCT